MARERNGYSAEERAVIAQKLREADELNKTQVWSQLTTSWLKREFGYCDFAEIECICREQGLNTYWLAIPANRITDVDPFIVIDVNDEMKRAPYAALVVFGGLNGAIKVSTVFGMQYDKDVNLENLRHAGACIPDPTNRHFLQWTNAPLN